MSGDNHVREKKPLFMLFVVITIFQLVWYDLTQGVMWAAFAAPFGTGGAKV